MLLVVRWGCVLYLLVKKRLTPKLKSDFRVSITPWKFDNILSIAYADSELNLHATRVLLPVNQSAVSINPACKLHTNYVLMRIYYFFFFFNHKDKNG